MLIWIVIAIMEPTGKMACDPSAGFASARGRSTSPRRGEEPETSSARVCFSSLGSAKLGPPILGYRPKVYEARAWGADGIR